MTIFGPEDLVNNYETGCESWIVKIVICYGAFGKQEMHNRQDNEYTLINILLTDAFLHPSSELGHWIYFVKVIYSLRCSILWLFCFISVCNLTDAKQNEEACKKHCSQVAEGYVRCKGSTCECIIYTWWYLMLTASALDTFYYKCFWT